MYQLYRDFNLVKKGPKNLGMGKPPPPLFGQCPKENVLFLMRSSLRAKLTFVSFFLIFFLTFPQALCYMAGWAGCDWAFPSNIPARLISPKLQQIKISNKLLKSINKVNRRRMQPKPTKIWRFSKRLGRGAFLLQKCHCRFPFIPKTKPIKYV